MYLGIYDNQWIVETAISFMSGVIFGYFLVQLVISKILGKLNKNNTQYHIKISLALGVTSFSLFSLAKDKRP